MQTLNDLMGFGHIVESDGNGSVGETQFDEYGPEVVYVEVDDEGQMTDLTPAGIDMAGYGDWELLRGFTGQYGYSGPIMHESEYIGGALETHIRDHAGLYVAVVVDAYPADNEDIDNDRCCGWAVAFKAIEEAGA